MTLFTPATRRLAELMAEAPRGPRRDGLFALWLTVRVVEDLPQTAAPMERAARRRAALLRKRLSSLNLAPALRRGLAAVIDVLEETPQPPRGALMSQLAGVARDGVSAEAGDALARGTRGFVPR